MQRYKYTIEFRTSFVQGAGAGMAGLADDMSVTAEGIPFVQGDGVAHEVRRNIRQMWAGQREYLCEGQEASPIDPTQFCDANGDSCCLYCRMFGRRKDLPRRWDFGDAHLPPATQDTIRKALNDKLASERSVFLPHARTAMNPKRRRADEGKLFAIGRAIPFGAFSGTVTYNGPGEPEADEVKAIRLGFELIRGLGRGKRRGVGEARAALDENAKPLATTRLTGSTATSASPASWRLTITLSSEVGFPSRPGRGNEYDTLPYIPGRAIWGALAGLMGLSADKPASEAEMHLLYEDIRVLNAYPLVDHLVALPAPLSARRRKDLPLDEEDDPWDDKAGRIADWLLTGSETGAETWVPLSRPFVRVASDSVRAYRPRLSWRGHNTPRAPRAPSSTDGDGSAFYATQVLEGGQQFQGSIECTQDRSRDLFEELMNRLATWGALRLKGQEHTAELTRAQADWFAGHQKSSAAEGEAGQVLLTILSPAIVTDKWGRTPSVLSSKWLADQLDIDQSQVHLARHYSAVSPVLGESGAWGLPLAAEHAIASGSAFLYEIADANEGLSDRLLKLSRHGIGRRRPEGFGQVIVNWRFHWELAPRGGAS